MPDATIGTLLWIISGGAALFTILLGLVLAYHWVRFAMNAFATTLAIGAYIIVTSLFLLTLFGVAATYSV